MKELDKAITAFERAVEKIDAILTQDSCKKSNFAGQEGVQICPKCNKMFVPSRISCDPTICSDCRGGGDSWSSSAQNNGLKTADDAQNNGKTPEVAPDVTPEVTDLDGLTVNNKGAG